MNRRFEACRDDVVREILYWICISVSYICALLVIIVFRKSRTSFGNVLIQAVIRSPSCRTLSMESCVAFAFSEMVSRRS